MALLYLAKRVGVVVGGDGDVTAVKDGGPAMERICIEGHIVATIEVESTRALSDARGPKSSTWAVRSTSVKWSSNKRYIEFLNIACEAREIRQTSKGADAREDGVGL